MSAKRRRKGSAAQTIGGVLFGFEQQVWRTAPPPHELVHHARPDDPVPAGDGSLLTIGLPDDRVAPPAEPESSAEPPAEPESSAEPEPDVDPGAQAGPRPPGTDGR